MRWLFPGQEVAIESQCLDCGEPFQIRMQDSAILEAHPATLVAHVNIAFSRRHEFTDAYR